MKTKKMLKSLSTVELASVTGGASLKGLKLKEIQRYLHDQQAERHFFATVMA
jgi:hypothetical protein